MWLILGGCGLFLIAWLLLFFKGGQFLHLPQWARLSIMCSLAAMMFGVVYLSQNEARKDEKTLMTVCWVPGTYEQAAYQDDLPAPLCDAPEELVWAKKTKKVFWALGSDYDVYDRSYDEALKYWNREMDHTVFVKTDNEDEADIVIQEGAANSSGNMSTSHFRDGDQIVAVVRVNVPGDIRRFMLELEHELGHCLGLAHDAGSSIMNRTLPEGEQMRVWFVTSKDKKRLEEVMGL